MSFHSASSLAIACCTLAPLLPAQSIRNIDLTGRPAGSLTETFSELTGFATAGAAAVVVSDGREQRLVRIEVASGRSTPIGTRGDGPLEYRVFGALFNGRADSVWMGSGLKVVQVTPAGRIARSIPSPGNEPGNQPRIQRLLGSDNDGALYFMRTPSGSNRGSDAVILRWVVASRTVDTVAALPEPKRNFGTVANGVLRLDPAAARHLEGRDHWLPMPDGRLVVVRHDPYRIDFVDRSGRVTQGTPIPHASVPVTAADREAHRAVRRKARMANAGPPGSTNTANRPPELADVDFVTIKPPFTAVRVSPEGEIWVLRTRPAADSVPSYDIFDRTGRLTARARLRPHSTVVGFAPGSVWVARESLDDDLIHLERYSR